MLIRSNGLSFKFDWNEVRFGLFLLDSNQIIFIVFELVNFASDLHRICIEFGLMIMHSVNMVIAMEKYIDEVNLEDNLQLDCAL